MLVDGIHPAMDRDSYDALARVNFSSLKHLSRSPAHYRHYLTEPPDDTDAKKVGRVVHLAAFEPEKFRASIAVWDGGTRRGKDWDQFRERNIGRELLTEAEYEKCMAIQRAVRADARAMAYVSDGRGEVSLAWTLEAKDRGANSYTVACKGRIDFDAQTAIVDLKTTKDGSPEGFGRQVWGLKYYVQAAWYVDGYARATGIRKPYVIVAVENFAPYIVTTYRVPERHLHLGREEYWHWLDQLAYCRETSRWPGYAETELEIELPRWADADDEDLSELGLVVGG
jgi:hypothetical protein